MATSDILVIGGGIVGLVAATRLLEAGATVTLVDAGVNAGSTANAGSLHCQMQSRFMKLYPDQVPAIEASLPLYRASIDEWQRLDGVLGPFELVRNGGLMVAESADQMAFLERKAVREADKGLRVDILDRSELDRIAPWLGPQIIGAELCYDEGKLNPLVANARFRKRAANLGIESVVDWITRVDVMNDGVSASGEKGTYAAEQAVVATGWGTGPLLAGTGVNIPSLGEPLHMNITEPCQAQINHLVQHAERSITLKQFGSGQVVIGGGWAAKNTGTSTVPQILLSSLLGNIGLAARLVPAIKEVRVIRSWAGMNTTVDGASVIGPLPGAERITVAVPGDAGYTLGPLVARMATDMMMGKTPPYDPAEFSPCRFVS